MGNKKIRNIFWKKRKASKKSYSIKNEKDSFSLSDLKHDLEEQIVKINQELEGLKLKSNLQNSTIRKQYEDVFNNFLSDSSRSLTFIDRIANQLSVEIVCINILSGNHNIAYESKQSHIVYRTIHRLLMLYEDNFNRRSIRYSISPSTLRWKINDNIFSAILLRIIQNATKYCLHDSTVSIEIHEEKIIIIMTSLEISEDEIEKIFENWFIWKNWMASWLWKTWKGLYHAKKLAEFHNFKLKVINWESITTWRNWLKYWINKFIIQSTPDSFT